MDTTQFSMVEELASLVKDNLYSKHLVLSTEEAFLSLLQHTSAVDGTLELPPASSYHRLLLHRLADIYGFAHESVGEGDHRHLVIQRCPETVIPPVLVSDVLWEYDDDDASTSLVLTKNDTDLQGSISVESSHLKADSALKPLQSASLPAASFEEREAAYQAARQRIFSMHDSNEKDTLMAKSRQVPVVAQRMIAHALGQKIHNTTGTAPLMKGKGKEPAKGPNIPKNSSKIRYPATPDSKRASNVWNGNSSSHDGNSNHHPSNQSRHAAKSRAVSTESLKKEQIGAAKRMLAHALGLPSVQGSNGAAPKPK